MNEIFSGTFNWIREDYKSHRVRFCLEVIAWAISIGCSITMALTVPTPPLIILYPIWITGCAIYAWCAYSRRSFGMLANYVLLTTIDTIGLIRMLVAA
jgi:cellulose synthase/poly-beta-1,6-N-acetylglucosamine synthase-like glycosyltransferase